MNDQLQFM